MHSKMMEQSEQFAIRPRAPLGPSCLRRGRAAITCLLLTVLLLSPIAGQAADLFTPVTEARSSLPSDDLTLRSRAVTIDFTQLQRARQTFRATAATPRDDSGRVLPESDTTLTFNLFDDVVVTAVVEHTAPTYSGGYSVSGRLVDEPLSSLTLVVNGQTVAGTVQRMGEIYHIRSVGEGQYAISEVAESPLNCGVEAVPSTADHQH